MVDALLMAGKSVLVTGGTGGIGRATAIGLAALGARVGITGRDPARTEAAAASIRAAPGRPAVDAFAADMSVQAGVRRLAAQVLDTYPRLDVLVNNVGGFWAHRHVTADGVEHTFALNHLAPFLLTSLLLDRLTASAPARIVTVSSGAHARGRIDFDDLQGERNYSGQRASCANKTPSRAADTPVAAELPAETRYGAPEPAIAAPRPTISTTPLRPHHQVERSARSLVHSARTTRTWVTGPATVAGAADP
jgi:NAD(P)-dependent dehydrogenase (short-subunit alcohol dehydrogenase family)